MTVQKPITRTVLQPQSVTVLTSKVETSVVPETYTESVPVTTTRQVVEEQGGYETRSIPVTTTVPVAGCAPASGGHGGLFSRCGGGAGCGHKCGHRCGGGCALCGGGGWAGDYTTETTYTYQQVYVSRPVIRYGPRDDLCEPDQDPAGSRAAGRPGARDSNSDGPRDRQRRRI